MSICLLFIKDLSNEIDLGDFEAHCFHCNIGYLQSSSVSDMLHTLGWRSRATSRLCSVYAIPNLPDVVQLASHTILISSHTDILHDPHVKQGDRYQASVSEHTNLSCFQPILTQLLSFGFTFHLSFILLLSRPTVLLFTNLPRSARTDIGGAERWPSRLGRQLATGRSMVRVPLR